VIGAALRRERRSWPGPPTEYLTDVLDRLMARCAADAACSAAFPDIGKSFLAAIDTLAREPLVMGPPVGAPMVMPAGAAPALDQQRFVEAVFNVMYGRQLLALVPMMVHETSKRTPGLLGMIAKQLLTTRGSRGGRPALLTTVHCASVNTWAGNQKPTRESEVQEFATGFPGSCETLRPFVPATGGLQPVSSDIPTLIFTGEFDPVVPRSSGPVVARTLSRSQLVEIPAGGHTESMAHECTRGLVGNFIVDPERKLDTTCLTTLPPLRFAIDPKTAMQALGVK
jgi:pimeloyl-ACP methyl ester carboxylesterase